jgi:nucleotide-binding universal stress UspA family protein
MAVLEQRSAADMTETTRKVRISTVVLPVDFSTLGWEALPLAEHVARRFDAQVRPVHVDTASPWLDDVTESALQLRATPFGRPVSVTVVAAPDPVTGVTDFVGGDPATLIAMSSHGHSGIGELAFGSVGEGILRSTDATVLTVGPRFDVARHAFIRRIVVCVDMTTGGEAILPEALAWARTLKVPLELVTVVSRTATSDLPEQEVAARFDRLVSELSATYPDVTGLMLKGSRPATEIVRHVSALRGTLVAMATHARPAVARTIVGSTAGAVLRHSPAGVLLCRRP